MSEASEVGARAELDSAQTPDLRVPQTWGSHTSTEAAALMEQSEG